ncbi:hypothetical protein CWI36_0235p0020 [Hamiltosporidium magnivora]|uniref:Uncharacterized protein n=1 Tax=Hamiltosporidium magnivora TaxID=148818 RepID=A0A4Q9LHV9_9MICR|nr:hypothetical protein CWI36_0235p0020 [Hamiltosporidium magnivora]
MFLYNIIYFLNVFWRFDLVTSCKFTYIFKRNLNEEILFFRENIEESVLYEEMIDFFSVTYIFSIESQFDNNMDTVFIYKKDNFIQFRDLNVFLASSSLENKCKSVKIQCGYELSYYLMISKDITEIPDEISNFQFRCMLRTLICLKAVENKNIIKLIRAILCKYFLYQNINKIKNEFLDFKEIFSSGFSKKINFFIKESLISAFLDIFMVNYEFYDGNLIIFENSKKVYDVSLFDENIPYKNLLINNHTAFCILEHILEDSYILNNFKVLLYEMNIKSLILDNYRALIKPGIDPKFVILCTSIFKAIKISYFRSFSSSFLHNLACISKKDIDFLSLQNIVVSRDTLDLFLKKRNLKGLVLDNIAVDDNNSYFDDYLCLNDTLEYIFFTNVGINYMWWCGFFRRTNPRKIILIFYLSEVQNYFIEAFSEVNTYKNVLYLEILFRGFNISKEFCNSLSHWQSIRTLKLRDFKTNEDTEIFLLKTIEGMKELKYLAIQSNVIGRKLYCFLLRKCNIKVFELETCYLNKEYILSIDFFGNYNSLTKFALKRIKIDFSGLKEIFKIENLLSLALEACIVEPLRSYEPIDFMSESLKSLDLYGMHLNTRWAYDILIRLDNIESLNISYCNVLPDYLENLSEKCNLILKKFYYNHNSLYQMDLNRIKRFNTLEELNFYGCSFVKTNFHKLGQDCKFFNSLKKMNLYLVRLTLEDLHYFRYFKNLKNLKLTLFGSGTIILKYSLIYQTMSRYLINNDLFERDRETFFQYLHELFI